MDHLQSLTIYKILYMNIVQFISGLLCRPPVIGSGEMEMWAEWRHIENKGQSIWGLVRG